jgi:AmiR/NasT family two-component response regulator
MDGSSASAQVQQEARDTQVLLHELLETIAATDDGNVAALAQANAEIEGLREALRTRTVIGQAVGILMTEQVLSTDEAFAELVERSSHSNVKLRDVATRIVELADAEVERRRGSRS